MGKYAVFIKAVDKKQYPLKPFMPLALFILDAVGYGYATKYDRRILIKLAEIHGPKQAEYYLHIFWANRIVFLLSGILLIAAVGAGTGLDGALGVFSLLLMGGIIYFTDKEPDEKIKRRRKAIQLDFPDFLNKLVLLVNAGMTVTRAWEKAVLDNKKESPLYEELGTAITSIKSGKPQLRAYEDFAKKCRSSEIARFVSIILQNVKKGNSELVPILRVHANECWERRKSIAKELGEEASAKMIFPMMLMFAGILLIIITPAVLALRAV